MPRRKFENPRYEFPILAHVPCPACGKDGARVSATGQNAALYVSCGVCGGRMIKASFVTRYLLLIAHSIEFKNGWSLPHLEDLAGQYRHTKIERLAQFHGDDIPTLGPSQRAVATLPCPAKCGGDAEIRLTAKGKSPFLHCDKCKGQIVGAKATIAYMLRVANEVVFANQAWEMKYPGIVSRYW